MKKRTNQDLIFIMDQLRKDKIILSIESIVVFIAAFVFHQMLVVLGFEVTSVILTAYFLSTVFFIRMAVKNIKRKMHIRALERKVYGTEIKNIA